MLVAITGVESSGKTTLTRALAAQYQAPMVPEYARQYLNQLNRPYTEADLVPIATGQLAMQLQMAKTEPSLLLADTDLSVIAIWGLYKYNRAPKGIMEKLLGHLPQLYILPHWQIGWVHDPLRENPDEASRLQLYTMYENLLAKLGVPVCHVKGSPHEQLKQAAAAIDTLLA